jgi:hypothetical protein
MTVISFWKLPNSLSLHLYTLSQTCLQPRAYENNSSMDISHRKVTIFFHLQSATPPGISLREEYHHRHKTV